MNKPENKPDSISRLDWFVGLAMQGLLPVVARDSTHPELYIGLRAVAVALAAMEAADECKVNRGLK